MKYFAKLDSNNMVIDKLQFSDDTMTESGCATFAGGGTWKEYKLDDTSFRQRQAHIGGEYNSTHDVFCEPKPYSSWTLETTNYTWEAPVTEPSNDDSTHILEWDEDNSRWIRHEMSNGVCSDPKVTTYYDTSDSTWKDV